MAEATKTKKSKPKRTPEDVDLIKSDVASFASSLGLAPPTLSSSAGFDDSDFRKSGPLKPPPKPTDNHRNKDSAPPATTEEKNPDEPKSKPHPLDPFSASDKPLPDDKGSKPKFPLMKASSLSGQWYADADALEAKLLGAREEKAAPPVLGVEELKALALRKKEVGERLMEQYVRDYEASRRKNGDMRLLEMTARSGTSADKVSAFSCLVEDNPIANVRSLDGLLSMVTSKVGKRYAFTGFEAIKELFLLRLLPDRKLKCLFQHPLYRLPETKDGFSLLLFWYWEDCLKQRYERFVIALEDALKDMLPNLKDRAMKTVYILLKTKPEQERRLLSALVNKLGDPERKAASAAGYHLSCLLAAHPNMKAVVIEEVDSFLFRPHISMRAKYQAVNFLSQILLSKKGDGPKTAKRLVDVYFALFKWSEIPLDRSTSGNVFAFLEKIASQKCQNLASQRKLLKVLLDDSCQPLCLSPEVLSRARKLQNQSTKHLLDTLRHMAISSKMSCSEMLVHPSRVFCYILELMHVLKSFQEHSTIILRLFYFMVMEFPPSSGPDYVLLDILGQVLIAAGIDAKKTSRDGHNDNRSGRNVNAKRKNQRESKKEQPVETNVEMDSRLLSALLTGVNRAFPYVSSDEADDLLEVQTPILFKLVHSENFNVGVQALMLLYQISSKNQIASDRFYRALYARLVTPSALSSSKPEMFLGLLVKAMKNDINLKRVSAFSKRLLQVALQRPPQYACGCLFLLSEILKAKPPLWTMVLQNECIDDDLEHFEDIVEDPESALPPSSDLVNPQDDVASENGEGIRNSSRKGNCETEGIKNTIVSDDDKEQAPKPHISFSLPAGYNPRHREPSYCNADRVSWWELSLLASHVHPSVATMARTLLSGANIVYNGDPLNDLSLSSFLDKFMEKKPKQNKKAEGIWHGGSQIAPARKVDLNHHLIGDEILQLAEEEVPPEDVVFHRFYTNKTGSSKKPKKKKKPSAEDEMEEDIIPDASDESEAEIDSMLESGRSPLEKYGDYDYNDLDTVGADDDIDLLGNDSDLETGSPTEHVEESGSDDEGSADIWDGDLEDSDADVAPVDDDSDDRVADEIDTSSQTRRGKKRKEGKSPFASLEEYENLIIEDNDVSKNSKPRSKKRKSSG